MHGRLRHGTPRPRPRWGPMGHEAASDPARRRGSVPHPRSPASFVTAVAERRDDAASRWNSGISSPHRAEVHASDHGPARCHQLDRLRQALGGAGRFHHDVAGPSVPAHAPNRSPASHWCAWRLRGRRPWRPCGRPGDRQQTKRPAPIAATGFPGPVRPGSRHATTPMLARRCKRLHLQPRRQRHMSRRRRRTVSPCRHWRSCRRPARCASDTVVRTAAARHIPYIRTALHHHRCRPPGRRQLVAHHLAAVVPLHQLRRATLVDLMSRRSPTPGGSSTSVTIMPPSAPRTAFIEQPTR